MKNPLPEFFLNLIQAHQSSQRVDNFDSGDATDNSQELETLCTQQNADALTLINYVIKYEKELKEILGG